MICADAFFFLFGLNILPNTIDFCEYEWIIVLVYNEVLLVMLHTYHMLSRIHAYMMRRWYAKSLALHLWNRRICIQWKLGGMNATALRGRETKPWVIINQQYYIMLHIPSVVFHPMRVQSRLTCCGRLCVFDLFQFPAISREMKIRKSLQIMWA